MFFSRSNSTMARISLGSILLCCWIGCCCVAADDRQERVEAAIEINESCHEDFINRIIDKQHQAWILSILASCVIALSGVVPLIFIPIECGAKLNQKGGSKLLRLLLSFAVGGLLGDVFLHLLPEAWNHRNRYPNHHSSHLTLGLWVLLGMFSFVIIEIMFTASKAKKEQKTTDTVNSESSLYSEMKLLESTELSNSACNNDLCYEMCSSHAEKTHQNGRSKVKPIFNGVSEKETACQVLDTIHISGYLNLMANSIDNFTHGLAVAASFLVGNKMGILTTFAILIHEIPHEFGDFAILLKSGFHPWNAAKAQMSTATIGVLGAIVALSAESIDQVGACTSWILPFTSGGFLNIALVNVLPDILKEKDPWESVKQMLCICGGIGVMALVNLLVQ